MSSLMQGKRGLIMGVANDRSIGWGIAQAVAREGAELAFTYQGEILEKRVRPLATSLNSDLIIPCDVTNSASIQETFQQIQKKWGSLDFIVHAIAHSDKDQLKGRYLDTTLDNFLRTMHVSCFSLTEICRQAAPLLREGGSILTLTYYGSEKVLPNYNVMGVAKAALEASVRYLAVDLGGQNVRVNAISAGPIKTLAASGVSDFRFMLKWNEINSPLHRNISLEDVGNAGLYLLSDLSRGITGEIQYVDNGYNILGMINMAGSEELADILKTFKAA